MPPVTEPRTGGPAPPGTLPPEGGDPDHGGEPSLRGTSRQASLLGIVITMIASVMTFASLIIALYTLRGGSNSWKPILLPGILWGNTAVLMLSSVMFEVARRFLRRGGRVGFERLWLAGTLLGVWFLVGQAIAWRDLARAGFYLSGNPSSAFFYVLTWTHAAHVIVNLAAVIYVAYRALRFHLGPGRRTLIEVTTIFWHFLGVMWLLLIIVFLHWT